MKFDASSESYKQKQKVIDEKLNDFIRRYSVSNSTLKLSKSNDDNNTVEKEVVPLVENVEEDNENSKSPSVVKMEQNEEKDLKGEQGEENDERVGVVVNDAGIVEDNEKTEKNEEKEND